MSSALTIRSALPGDLPGLLALMHHLIPDDLDPDSAASELAWSRMMAMDGMTVLLAELPDVAYPVATCTLIIVPNLTRGARSQGMIENVVTHSDYRKRGIGRAMLGAAVAAAWRENCYRIMLTTGPRPEDKQEQVLRFYEQAGFVRGTKTTFEMRHV